MGRRLAGWALMIFAGLLSLRLLKSHPQCPPDATIFWPKPEVAIQELIKAAADGDAEKICGMGTPDFRHDLELMYPKPGSARARESWSRFSRSCLASSATCLSKPEPFGIHGGSCIEIDQQIDSLANDAWFLRDDGQGWYFVGFGSVSK